MEALFILVTGRLILVANKSNSPLTATSGMDAIGLYNITLGTGSVLLVLIGLVFVHSHAKPRHRRPPGPKGLPIVGNLFQIPGQVSKIFHFLSTYIDGQ